MICGLVYFRECVVCVGDCVLRGGRGVGGEGGGVGGVVWGVFFFKQKTAYDI